MQWISFLKQTQYHVNFKNQTTEKIVKIIIVLGSPKWVVADLEVNLKKLIGMTMTNLKISNNIILKIILKKFIKRFNSFKKNLNLSSYSIKKKISKINFDYICKYF